ncbi:MULTISPECIES: DUF3883 domain-containing protein [unclassified Mycolicibacterium]|uniref:DUF3883 domain-containing protein n=1 Tax=unclassified Mycolicibacterium TaxID=2636767 RepID=UPI001391736A|nr:MULTISPECIES: DUF3883 domain-containing protein [unclassified Mycolicibacterium]
MRLPPEPLLLAAKRWLEILPTSGGIPRAQALLTTHWTYSDLTPTQYASALTWIRELGLLTNAGSPVPAANQVLSALLEKCAPPWFQDADELVRGPDELPTDIVSAGVALGLDPNAVYEQLVASWGKVDTAAREEVGAAGEAALVALLEENAGYAVKHVALWSDGFGYDVDVSFGSTSAHLEVKSTTRRGRFTAYLSRNEYSVMKRDAHWLLVVLRLTPDLAIAEVGSLPSTWIEANVPRDTGRSGSWASCKLEIPAQDIVGGIPTLGLQASGGFGP